VRAIKHLVRILTVIIFASSAHADEFGDWTLSLIKKNKMSPDQFGFYWAKPNGSVILQNRADTLMMPASISKITTTSAVLEYLPPGTKFKTQMKSSAKIENGKLKGPLYLVGGGDPSFVSENMWILVNNFTRTQIKEVLGDICVDDSLFDSVRFDESRESSRVDRAYDAPVGAMSFNWNSMNVYVRPTEASKPATVILDPENDYLKLESSVRTKSSGSSEIQVDRHWDEKSRTEIVKVHGTIGENQKESVTFANVTQPDLWAGANLKSFLAQRGIKVAGEVKNCKADQTMNVLAEVDSKPVEMILADMNKFSNNFVAEMLTKNMAALDQKPATLKQGVAKVQNHLKDLGFDLQKDFVILNPSGLTRDNKVTAKAMWKLLLLREKDFSTMPEFMISLPIAGVDGTLKKRMKNDSTYRQVRAKTGSLTGVVSLAGYATDMNGMPAPFVFMYNGRGDQNGDESRARSVMDQILEKYYSQR
jgi:D-alanyl-D-alanine carboxypeptidase/D-alanyl-D-alanine-endopeptidase (penicillin-binding protein 4)